MREFLHYYGGKPPDRVEVPKSAGDDDRAARLGRLSEEQRVQYADILLRMEGPPA